MARDIGDVSSRSEVTSDFLVRIVDNPNSEFPVEKLIPGSRMAAVVGRAWTVNPALCGQATSIVTANRAWYIRITDASHFVDAVTQLRISVGVSSGNISVGVYSSTGTGIAARPATRKATTGAIACPSAGTSAVTLTTSVNIEAGDWLAIAADNTTATFCRTGTVVANLDGLVQYEAAAHPVPATATPLTTASPMPFYIEAIAP